MEKIIKQDDEEPPPDLCRFRHFLDKSISSFLPAADRYNKRKQSHA